ncbi:GntR family transcriptional regulator [Streptomyces sp. YPW6]|uniref:GntR family transcriptional regulator n=1 Tax=Streptomyces sp. YPW6 TaxID=2840373 RepID=UPI003D7492FA
MLAALVRRPPVDPAVAQTVDKLIPDIDKLRLVTSRRIVWSAEAVARAQHDIYATTGPWVRLARSRRDATDSPSDRARWDAWITALTPPERPVRGSFTEVCVLLGRAWDMLQALRTSLVHCLPVSGVAEEIERLIGTGELVPGYRISRARLAKRLRVPVEYIDLALADLASKGLVEVWATGSAAVTRLHDANGSSIAGGRQRAVVGEAGRRAR